jgi:hypothetical protein
MQGIIEVESKQLRIARFNFNSSPTDVSPNVSSWTMGLLDDMSPTDTSRYGPWTNSPMDYSSKYHPSHPLTFLY